VGTVFFGLPGVVFMSIAEPPYKVFELVATFESVTEYGFNFILEFTFNHFRRWWRWDPAISLVWLE
jgi:hypothetical protein